ncbi:MAG: HAMP domain-containing sensor histidine kinase [candidate division Zixibacteria bacterium]
MGVGAKIPNLNQVTEEEQKTLEFVSLFAHDLEGPLAAFKTILRLLTKDRFNPSKLTHQNLLSSCQIAMGRAESIIYDLMSAARAGQSYLVANNEPCNLNQAILDSCRMNHPAAEEDKIEILTNLAKKDITVMADPHLLDRILDNLIYNAIRYAPPRGQIIVSAEANKKEARVSVADTGEGFKDLNPDDLFTVFKQAEYRGKGLHRGVGIGLYLCRQAVEIMGGSIKAENAKQKGAIFRFTLPVNKEG